MTKWQYTTAQFVTQGLGDDSGASDLEAAMTRLGGDGWELVSSTVYHNLEAQQDVLLLIFKRPAVAAAPAPAAAAAQAPATLPAAKPPVPTPPPVPAQPPAPPA